MNKASTYDESIFDLYVEEKLKTKLCITKTLNVMTIVLVIYSL